MILMLGGGVQKGTTVLMADAVAFSSKKRREAGKASHQSQSH